MRDSLSNTPDWFETRRAEIRREGYPDLNSAPGQNGKVVSEVSWEDLRSRLSDAQLTLDQHEKAATAQIPRDIDVWLAEKRAEVDKGMAPY